MVAERDPIGRFIVIFGSRAATCERIEDIEATARELVEANEPQQIPAELDEYFTPPCVQCGRRARRRYNRKRGEFRCKDCSRIARRCAVCKIVKPAAAFSPREHRCKPCNAARVRKRDLARRARLNGQLELLSH